MKYTSAIAFRQALEDRLRAEAARTGLSPNRLRKRIAFELFLKRLLHVSPDRWVLKGAFALDLRFGAAARPTKDVDLCGQDSKEAAIEDIGTALQVNLGDYFAFTAVRTTDFNDVDDFSAIRFDITAELAGRTFERFIVDIGFLDSLKWEPDKLATPDFLRFAEILPMEVPAIPLSQHIAEKVHAYTRMYGEPPRHSSRPKDLVDILLIATFGSLIAMELYDRLLQTFQGRGRQPLPNHLPEPPREWTRPYARLAKDVAAEPNLAAAYREAQEFLDPLLARTAKGSWSPSTRTWR